MMVLLENDTTGVGTDYSHKVTIHRYYFNQIK